jgi:hypothetical protein
MERIEEEQQTDEAPRLTLFEWVRNAAATNLVLLLAWVTSGLIFAADPAMALMSGLELTALAWCAAAPFLLPIWLVSLLSRPQEAAEETLHDSWLDDARDTGLDPQAW